MRFEFTKSNNRTVPLNSLKPGDFFTFADATERDALEDFTYVVVNIAINVKPPTEDRVYAFNLNRNDVVLYASKDSNTRVTPLELKRPMELGFK